MIRGLLGARASGDGRGACARRRAERDSCPLPGALRRRPARLLDGPLRARRRPTSRKALRSRGAWRQAKDRDGLQPLGWRASGKVIAARARMHLRGGARPWRRQLGNKRELARRAQRAGAASSRRRRARRGRAPLRTGPGARPRARRPRKHRHRAAQSRDGLDRPRDRAIAPEQCCSKCWRSPRDRLETRGAKRAGSLRRSRRIACGMGAHRAILRSSGSATAQTGLHRDPADEAFLAPFIAKARDALGEAAFGAAEAAGKALSNEAAMTEAQAWLGGC